MAKFCRVGGVFNCHVSRDKCLHWCHGLLFSLGSIIDYWIIMALSGWGALAPEVTTLNQKSWPQTKDHDLTYIQSVTYNHDGLIGFCWSLTEWPIGYLIEIFRWLICKPILTIGICGISCKIALRLMLLDLNDDDKSILLQVMDWCHQAAGGYFGPVLHHQAPPNGINKQQWVNIKYFLVCHQRHTI